MKPRILLAVDGSESCAWAAKHVGRILQHGAGCEVTLLHVLLAPAALLEYARLRNEPQRGRLGESLAEKRDRWVEMSRARVEEEVFVPARELIEDTGARRNGASVQTKLVADEHHDAAAAICREVEDGDYDAVVLGRRRRLSLIELFGGSVARKVCRGLRGCGSRAVWIVG